MTDADGRVATLCGGRIGTASHPQGGPSRAYLIGTRQSATIDAKRPALDAYLRDYSTDYDYQPNPQDPMQWHGGPPVPTAALSEDTAGHSSRARRFGRRYRRRPPDPLRRAPSAGFDGNYSRWLPRRRVQRGC